METTALRAVPDDELLRRLRELVSQSRRVEADSVAHIGEVDARRLYARFAFPSMFAYCTEGLHLSEAGAYRRITVARAARRHPALIAHLRDGRLHLSGIALLAPLLTPENCAFLLERATHLSKRRLAELVAELSPRPDVAPTMRKLPQPRLPESASVPVHETAVALVSAEAEPVSGRVEGTASGAELVPGRVETGGSATASDEPRPAMHSSSARRPEVEPLSPGRYKVQFTASAQLRDKIERLTALMRSEIPDGDLAAVLERAVTEKLERLEARRFAKTAAPAPRTTAPRRDADLRRLRAGGAPTASRYIPAAVRRAVHERDGDRCRFVDEQGRRCSERNRLEFHHRHPFGMGGDHVLGNISLLCAAHNRSLAEHDYGAATVRRHLPEER
jgi:hypothetical protein